jgi:MSHA biogenesis protein MshO
MRHSTQLGQRGFTLVEIVIAIVIMAIISIGLVQFIVDSAAGYAATSARNQVSAAGRVVIDRMSMELRNAIPESIRIAPALPHPTTDANAFAGDQCVEFIPVRAATTYIDPAFRPGAYKTSFDVVDFIPAQLGQNGVYAVVYPTSDAELYDVTFGPGNETRAIARVNVTNGAGANTDTLTYSRLSDSAAYSHRFRRQSAVKRLFLTDQPVSYCISGNKLYRYSNYGFTAVQKLPVRPNGTCAVAPCLPSTTANSGRWLVSDQVDNSALTGLLGAGQAFNWLVASRRRNGVLQLEINFNRDGQEVLLNHEVMQQTTP